jgi:hypothetical protein
MTACLVIWSSAYLVTWCLVAWLPGCLVAWLPGCLARVLLGATPGDARGLAAARLRAGVERLLALDDVRFQVQVGGAHGAFL